MTARLSLENSRLVKVYVSDVFLRTEVDVTKHQMHDYMQLHGKCHAMFILEPRFSNLQAFVAWEDIDVDKVTRQSIARWAVVGDLRGRDSALLFLFNSVVPFQIEYFPGHQESFASVLSGQIALGQGLSSARSCVI